VDERAPSEIAALAARLDELSQDCARLSQENADLRMRMSRLTPATGPAAGRAEPPARTLDGAVSRRMAGKALGAAAAGVVGAIALAEAGASPAAAADGDSVSAGRTTNAEGATTLNFDGTTNPGVVFLANDTAFDPSNAVFSAALGGWADSGHVSNGIFGYSGISAGNGVVGEIAHGASSGSGVLGVASNPNTVAVKAENPSGTAFSAVSGVTGSGQTAILGIITSTAPQTSSTAIHGQNNGMGNFGIGVQGSHAGNGTGVVGIANGGTGVQGVSGDTETSFGVSGLGATGVYAHGTIVGVTANGPTAVQAAGTAVGVTASGVTGVQAAGSTRGVNASGPTGLRGIGTGTASVGVRGRGDGAGGRGGVFSGAAAQAQFVPGALASHPRSGSRGDLYADKNGRLWFCKKTGNPALWHQIALYLARSSLFSSSFVHHHRHRS
jgi:hypothetical protein